jgi:CheY-like chemotaxis protein
MRMSVFDFCLVDWMLPDGSGLDLVDDIRRDGNHRDVGILVISSRSERSDIVTAFRSAIDGYVAKPFNASQLRAKIDEVWQRRARSRAKSKQIQLIIEGQDELLWSEKRPLLIFGESVSTAEELAKIQNAHVLDYLSLATTAVDSANAFTPRLQLAYYIASSVGEVLRLLKGRQTRDRVAMAFVSSSCAGNYLLMARLIQMRNLTSPVCIISDLNADLRWRERKELEAAGTVVFGRRELDEYRWRDIMEGYALTTRNVADDDFDDISDEEMSRRYRRATRFWLPESRDHDSS